MTEKIPPRPNQKPNSDSLRLGFARALQEDGLSRTEVLKAYRRFRPDGRKMLLSEFLAHRLYRPDVNPDGFIGVAEATELARRVNGPSRIKGVVGNKLLSDSVFGGLGFPVPKLQAVFGIEAGPQVVRLETRADLRQFFAETATFPIFGKPKRGQGGEGAVYITRYDAGANRFTFLDGSELQGRDFFSMLERQHRKSGYLFQSAVIQDARVEALIGKTVGTLRFVTFTDETGPEILGVALRLPRFGSNADNHALGGYVMTLDQQSGVLDFGYTGLGPGAEQFETHPDTGTQLRGVQLPHWDAARTMVATAAACLSELPLIGWDIALGTEGPVIIEANTSPTMEALQLGQSSGILRNGRRARMLKARTIQRRVQKRRRIKTRWGVLKEVFRRFGSALRG